MYQGKNFNNSSFSKLYSLQHVAVICRRDSGLYPGSTKLNSCWKPFPSTVDIGRKSRAMNSAISVVIVFARAGEQVFVNALRVACLCGAQVSPGTAFLYATGCLASRWLSKLLVPPPYIRQTHPFTQLADRRLELFLIDSHLR